MDKVTRQCPQTTTIFDERGEPKRYRTEVLPLTSLTARPNRLTRRPLALRSQKRDGLLGTGTGGKEDERVKARPRIPPEKDRRDREPPPGQWMC